MRNLTGYYGTLGGSSNGFSYPSCSLQTFSATYLLSGDGEWLSEAQHSIPNSCCVSTFSGTYVSLTFHYNLVSCHGSFSFPQRGTRWSPIKEMHFAIVEGNIFVRTLCEGGLKSGRRDYLPTPQEENHADFKNLISSSKTGCSDILCVIVANIRCNILNYPLI